jgi:hypothetical protein
LLLLLLPLLLLLVAQVELMMADVASNNLSSYQHLKTALFVLDCLLPCWFCQNQWFELMMAVAASADRPLPLLCKSDTCLLTTVAFAAAAAAALFAQVELMMADVASNDPNQPDTASPFSSLSSSSSSSSWDIPESTVTAAASPAPSSSSNSTLQVSGPVSGAMQQPQKQQQSPVLTSGTYSDRPLSAAAAEAQAAATRSSSSSSRASKAAKTSSSSSSSSIASGRKGLSARQELVLSNLVRVMAVINQHMAKQEEDRTTDFL